MLGVKRTLTMAGLLGIALGTSLGIAGAPPPASSGLRNLQREVPPYPGSRYLPIGDRLSVNGQARTLAYGRSGDHPGVVADFYERTWQARGLQVSRHQRAEETWISATAFGDPHLRTVMVRPQGTGSMTVASLKEAFSHQALRRAFVPEGCHVSQQHGARDGAQHTESLLLDCAMTQAQVESAYRAQLNAAFLATPAQGGIMLGSQGQEVQLLAETISVDPPRAVATVLWRQSHANH